MCTFTTPVISEISIKTGFDSYPCKIVDNPETPDYLQASLSWPFPKKSPYLKLFNYRINKFKENALYQRYVTLR